VSKNPDDKKNPAGRVKHDAGGRAIWEWAVDTGRHALDSTSRLLKRLELPGLNLLDEEQEKKKKAEEEDRAAREAGSNPYDNDVPTFGGPRETDPMAGSRRNFNPYDNRAPAKRSVQKPAAKPTGAASPAQAKDRPGLLSRLFGKK
jgi:hypothetical protein